MKLFVVTLGAAGCGKSSVLKKVKVHVIETDDLRLKFSSPVRCGHGWRINQNDGPKVEDALFQMLKSRMLKGHPCIVDSTHSRPFAVARYKPYLEACKYPVALALDFRDVPLEVCLARNRQRPELKQVPEDVVRDQWEFLQRFQYPDWLRKTTIEEVEEMLRQGGEYIDENP